MVFADVSSPHCRADAKGLLTAVVRSAPVITKADSILSTLIRIEHVAHCDCLFLGSCLADLWFQLISCLFDGLLHRFSA